MILIELEYQNKKVFLKIFWLNIVGTIYEKKLRKSNQKEFRVEKLI